MTPQGLRPASVRIRGGIIAAVGGFEDVGASVPVVEAGDSLVMPGVVDTHVHVNEPGRTEWEGFETATAAAAAGGVTTLLDMPLNSVPPTTTVEALAAKRRAAEGRVFVDVGFWGGLVPGNADELAALLDAGVFGFKSFLSPSGVPEFGHVGRREIREALPFLAERGAPLLVHAELPERLRDFGPGDPRAYPSYLRSRPPEAERDAVAMLLDLVRETPARTHVLHLSAAEALEPLARGKAEKLPLSAETCPHYLFFAAEEIPDGATEWKCAPPIRPLENRERLWQALESGLIDSVASDHSPAPPASKCRDSGDFRAAWGGIASLELALPAVWTGATARRIGAERLADWMCAAPARLAGLFARKGAIAPGFDADFVVWRPEETFRVEAPRLRQRHKLTPYAGRTLAGVVEATYLRGEKIFDRGAGLGRPAGRLLAPSGGAA